MTRARLLLDAAAAVVVAAATWLVYQQTFLNYDTFYALVWGDGLLEGHPPEYEVPFAPTPHPLATAVGALVSPLGDAAEEVFLAIGFLAIGWLCVGVFRLGEALFAWPVGLLAALIVATRVPILNYGVRGYVDLPAAALIVWAAALEARRPRRGAPVLVLLALAGLLRPEAWLFAAAYWVWVMPSRSPWERVALGGLAGLAPFVWIESDFLITENPVWSLTGTRAKAEALLRETGLEAVPGIAPRRLGEILRLPELIAAVVGFAAGLRLFPRRMALPIAVGALNGAVFLAFAAAGLPLLGRYLFLAATMLAVFAGVAAFGWGALERGHPARRPWQVGGALVAVAIVAFFPAQVERQSASRQDIADRDEVWDGLHALVRDPRARTALENCGRIFVPNHRVVPVVAYWTERRPSEILSAQIHRPTPLGTFLSPATSEAEELAILDPRDPRRFEATVPASYREVLGNATWTLYARCPSSAPARRPERGRPGDASSRRSTVTGSPRQ